MAKKRKGMAEPRDIEGSKPGKKGESQMYHEGSGYYGKGHGKMANMPTEVEMDEYPKPYRSLDNDAYPDTIEEIDESTHYNNRKVDERRSRSMY